MKEQNMRLTVTLLEQKFMRRLTVTLLEQKLRSKDLEKSHVSIGDQVADFLTKAVGNVSPDSVIDIDCKVVMSYSLNQE